MKTAQESAQTLEQDDVMNHEAVATQEVATEHVNPMANVWLGILAIVLGLTLLCTAVLVAWPILAYIGAKFF